MIQKATADIRAKNPATITFDKPCLVEAPQVDEIRRLATLGIRPTTDEDALNKTERAYLVWLRATQPVWMGVQCLTFKMGHDLRYTPDFVALDADGLRAIDTKGTRKSGKAHVEEDALVKMRIAARMFPFIRFVIAHKVGMVWNHVEVKS